MSVPEIDVPNIDPNILPRDWALARAVRHVLETHYPGWCWGVEIPPHQNVVTIRNLDCDPHGKHGFVLTPGRYCGSALEEDDGEPFEVRFPDLLATLEEQFAEAAELHERIQADIPEEQILETFW